MVETRTEGAAARGAGEAGGRLHVRIITPERIAYEGGADGVVATAYDGEFGILPRHAPMMVVLGIGEFRLRHGDRYEWFAIGEGFLHVLDDVVTVLTPYAESAREIGVETARRLEMTAAENPLLHGTILGEEQRRRLGAIRERVARKAR
ncbi:MAG TPA: ATP synthase F1 subunit epsilon [Gemmatimonadota bacterium]|nr:ATP synthase F1 subunit epsilon [Gemmatimonadota bacterium]